MQAAVTQNEENVNVHKLSQRKAQHRKYKRLKLHGSHAYDHLRV